MCAPILVSITSFFVYVWTGHELTIGTAFTVSPLALLGVMGWTIHVCLSLQSIALFQMIRAPLNAIPAWIVQVLQVCYVVMYPPQLVAHKSV